jgi:uncharacterized protein (TIGR02246 family)
MKHTLFWSGIHIVALACALQNAAEQAGPGAEAGKAQSDRGTQQNGERRRAARDEQAPSKTRNPRTRPVQELRSEVSAEQEKAIKQLVQDMQSAFNDHNAEAFAKYFAEEAEVVNVDDVRIHGRGAIQDVFADYFERNPEVQLEIEMHALRPLTDSLILEQGVSHVRNEGDQAEEVARYTVIYTRQDDDWRIAYARDSASQRGAEDQLQQLAWLIGDWIDESAEGAVITSYRWGEGERFIEGEYHVHAVGYPNLSGTLRIGWDPQAKQLRSWVFDSNGGFATGVWSQSDDGWTIKMTGVMSDGSSMTATNCLTRTEEDHLSYQSLDRTIGGEKMPDGEKLFIVRHPPQPTSIGKFD